ncbi:MAG: phosphodiesterase [Ruminococcus sp.]|nr:phosphodiesterase [Ruminococcus sp.]
MRYIIASDIHGSAHWCERLLARFEELHADRLILLGDILYHGPRNDLPDGYAPKQVIAMLDPLADRIICVRGNCEAEVDQMVLSFSVLSDSAWICDFGQRVFATHGHLWHPDSLPPLADGDIFLYGHTHVPMDEVRSADGREVRCINPGSVSIPKNGSPHRALMWEDGVFTEILL